MPSPSIERGKLSKEKLMNDYLLAQLELARRDCWWLFNAEPVKVEDRMGVLLMGRETMARLELIEELAKEEGLKLDIDWKREPFLVLKRFRMTADLIKEVETWFVGRK